MAETGRRVTDRAGRRSAEPEASPPCHRKPRPADPVRVLVVDDDEEMRSALEEALTLWGYQASTARSGAEGLELVIQQGAGHRLESRHAITS